MVEVLRPRLRHPWTAGCLCAAMAAGLALPAEAEPFTVRDMLDVVEVPDESIVLSPDGGRLAFLYPDVADEANILSRQPTGYVRIVDLGPSQRSGGHPAPGRDEPHSSFPAWSPDGSRLAYFIEEKGGYRLEVRDAESGETRRIGASFAARPSLAPQWGHRGRFIVFARPAAGSAPGPAPVFLPPPTFARAAKEHGTDDLPRVVVVNSDDERIPGDVAFVDDDRASLVAVDTANGDESALTEQPVHLRDFSVSPGRDWVTYRAPTGETQGVVGGETLETRIVPLDGSERPRSLSREGERFTWHPDGDRLVYLEKGRLFAMSLDGERTPLFGGRKAGDLAIDRFAWSPDGRELAVLVADESYRDPEVEEPMERMYTIDQPLMSLYLVSGRGRDVRQVSTGSQGTIDAADPVWSSDGRAVYFTGTDRDTWEAFVYRYEPGDGSAVRLTGGGEAIGMLDAGGPRIVFTAQTADHPPDIYAIDGNDGDRRRVVSLNPQLSRFAFSTPELFHFTNGDGERLGALLYRPVGVDPSARVPVITYVYEKLTPWRFRFNARHQIFLNHGFAVLMPNVKIRVGEPGTSFVKSVVPAVNAVRSMGFTNERFAVWGGSFGAYATSYIITQTDIFSCAVARATPPDLFGNWASGRDRDSRNIERGQARIGGSPYEYLERYLGQSAFFHLDQVETPVLIMHGAQDSTILFDEGETFFYALRQLGKKAELVAYLHGDHSLYRHSRADAIDVHERMLEWFDGCLR